MKTCIINSKYRVTFTNEERTEGELSRRIMDNYFSNTKIFIKDNVLFQQVGYWNQEQQKVVLSLEEYNEVKSIKKAVLKLAKEGLK